VRANGNGRCEHLPYPAARAGSIGYFPMAFSSSVLRA